MSHHANCILMPFRLEWFPYILDYFFLLFRAWRSMDGDRGDFNAAWFSLCVLLILHSYTVLTAATRQLFFTTTWYTSRTEIDTQWAQNSDLAAAFLAVQALLSVHDLGVRSGSSSRSDNKAPAAHTHTTALLCDLEMWSSRFVSDSAVVLSMD